MSHHIKDAAELKTKLVEAGNNLVVIDFFATWCGPCKVIAPIIDSMAAELPDVVFLKVDVDECEDIAAEYDISSMPTFIFIKNQVKVDMFTGASEGKLRETISSHRSS